MFYNYMPPITQLYIFSRIEVEQYLVLYNFTSIFRIFHSFGPITYKLRLIYMYGMLCMYCMCTCYVSTGIYIIREETLSLLRKGSRSRRLWESPNVPTERYERRPCLCSFRCTCRSRILYYSPKTDLWWGAFAEGNSMPLKQHWLLL